MFVKVDDSQAVKSADIISKPPLEMDDVLSFTPKVKTRLTKQAGTPNLLVDVKSYTEKQDDNVLVDFSSDKNDVFDIENSENKDIIDVADFKQESKISKGSQELMDDSLLALLGNVKVSDQEGPNLIDIEDPVVSPVQESHQVPNEI